MTSLDSVSFIKILLDNLNANQFRTEDIKIKIKNPCHNIDFIKVFKNESDFTSYIQRFKNNSGCSSTDFMLLEGLVVLNKNISLGHQFHVYNLGQVNNIIISQKFLFNNFKNFSNKSAIESYKNHLINLLKVYSIQRSQIIIPSSGSFYVDCCYVDEGYVL